MMRRTPFPAHGSPAGGQSSGVQTMPAPAVSAPRPAVASQYQTALEKDFPRILTAIQNMWGYPELNAYLRKLTLDNRGDREGFPKEVWEEIFTLLYVHQLLVPERP